jgi:hypothetical protein
LSHKDDEHKRADLYNSANNAPFHLWGHMAVERLTLHETEVSMMEKSSHEKSFLTQSELAKRWRLTESSIKNLRDKGHLPYFRLPGSSRILYPVETIEELERLHTTSAKEVDRKRHHTEVTRKQPDISATPREEWRI